MLNSVHGLIGMGGVFFWGLVLVECGVLCWCMADSYDKEDSGDPSHRGILATISIGVLAFILFVFGDLSLSDTLTVLGNHLYSLGFWAVAYVAVGLPWSFGQAWWASKTRGNPYRLARIDWLRNYGINSGDSVPDTHIADWQKFVSADSRLSRLRKGLTFSQQKARICRTLAYWPASMAWFFLAEIFSKGFETLCQCFHGVYQAAMDRAHADIAADFRPAPELVAETAVEAD